MMPRRSNKRCLVYCGDDRCACDANTQHFTKRRGGPDAGLSETESREGDGDGANLPARDEDIQK